MTSNGTPASSSDSPPSSRTSGVYGRSTTPLGVEPLGVLEKRSLPRRHVHQGSGALGEVGDAEEVVPVPVGHEDRSARRAEAGQGQAQLGRVAARVDHGGLLGGGVRADDVAVRPHRSERELVDAQRHRRHPQLPRRPSDCWRAARR